MCTACTAHSLLTFPLSCSSSPFSLWHRAAEELRAELEHVQAERHALEGRLEQLASAERSSQQEAGEHEARMHELER